ncbi:hypothetical protein vseg_008507 [Gypsophila vaccaria]
MDETVAKWMMEYLLRQKIDEKVIDDVFSTLPFGINDYRLKKTVLLRRIEMEIKSGEISEKIMETIEIMEAMEEERGKTASYKMKEAYSLVAVDCTARFIGESEEEMEKYREVVENVWRKRVCKSLGLFSETARRLWNEIEAAGENVDAWSGIWGRNTRNEALRAVKAFLKEAWEEVGPPVLEVVAERDGDGLEEGFRGGEDGAGEGGECLSVPLRNLVVGEGTQKVKAVTRRKHVAVRSRRKRGAKLSDADEGAMSKAGDSTAETVRPGDPTPEMDRANEVISSSPTKLPAASDRIAKNVQTAQILSSVGPTVIDSAVEAGHKGPEIPASNYAVRVQRELRNSAKELHAAVSDPLPEALKTAETLRSSTETNNPETAPRNQTGQEMPALADSDEVPTAQDPAEKMSTNSKIEAEASKQAETEVDASKRSNGDAVGNLTQHSEVWCNTRKRSLMEPNDTSQTFKWDDEIENSSGSPVRPGLPTPKVQRRSPLKVPECQAMRRRERKRWTLTEEDALREAVLKYGRGNWKFMLLDAKYAEVFKCRTEVDLKDKWRNMTKYS